MVPDSNELVAFWRISTLLSNDDEFDSGMIAWEKQFPISHFILCFSSLTPWDWRESGDLLQNDHSLVSVLDNFLDSFKKVHT